MDIEETDNSSRPKTADAAKWEPESDEENLPVETDDAYEYIYDANNLFYDMSGRKLMYIFNHRFEGTDHERTGTHRDVEILQNTFGQSDRFEVEEPYHDYTYDQITDKLKEICKMNHDKTSCIIIVVLTHGEADNKVWASDQMYPVSDIINPVLFTPSLAGKPKLFFIQACRGHKRDPGIAIDGPIGNPSMSIPTHADCLVLRSSYDEYVSFRTSGGSWMIQALCKEVDKHYDKHHILDILTLVVGGVAKHMSWSFFRKNDKKKQVPEVRYTLTKFLKFKDIKEQQ